MSEKQNPLYSIKLLDPTVDKSEGDVIDIYKDSIIAGRSESSTIQYVDNWISVSRMHAEIFKNANGLFIKNGPESKNQIFVNRKLVTGDGASLSNKDKIQLSYNGPQFQVIYKRKQTKSKIDLLLMLSFTILLFSIASLVYRMF